MEENDYKLEWAGVLQQSTDVFQVMLSVGSHS
jgi:hypothetical protein